MSEEFDKYKEERLTELWKYMDELTLYKTTVMKSSSFPNIDRGKDSPFESLVTINGEQYEMCVVISESKEDDANYLAEFVLKKEGVCSSRLYKRLIKKTFLMMLITAEIKELTPGYYNGR